MPTNENDSSERKLSAYEQLESDFREKIGKGYWRPGALLPSRRSLAKQYGVGLITVERAVANLVADGTLEAQDRRGTFVSRRRAPSQSARPTPRESAVEIEMTERRLPQPDPVVRLAMIAPIFGSEFDSWQAITEHDDTPLRNCRMHVLWHSIIASSLESAVCARCREPVRFENHDPYNKTAPTLTTTIRALLQEGANAFVINSVYGSYENLDLVDEAVAALHGRPETPLVFITSREIPDPVSQVFCDHRFEGYGMAEYLLLAGYKRLLALRPFAEDWLEARLDGVAAAIRHAGLPAQTLQRLPDYDTPWSSWPSTNLDRAMEAAFAQLRAQASTRSGGPIAVIAPNDGTAYKVMRMARDAGLQWPRDFGICGFDDDVRSRGVGLTTMRPPLEDLGVEAAHLVYGSLTGEQVRRQVRLHSRLIVRPSTALSSVRSLKTPH